MNISSKDDCGRYVLDTENIRFVFAAVKDTILQLNLKEYNLVWGCCVLLLTMLLHVGACADDTRHVLTLAWQWHSIAKHGTPQLPWAATCFVVSVGILNQIAFVQKIYIHTHIHMYACMGFFVLLWTIVRREKGKLLETESEPFVQSIVNFCPVQCHLFLDGFMFLLHNFL